MVASVNVRLFCLYGIIVCYAIVLSAKIIAQETLTEIEKKPLANEGIENIERTQGESLYQKRLEDLGRVLFFDVSLSANRTQSCATCHDPARAFTDWRDSGKLLGLPKIGTAVSLGDDGISLGDRGAPTASYAALTPALTKTAGGYWEGGLFHDGRASTLEAQAVGPPLNPIEMALKDAVELSHRLQENPQYIHEFKALFGEDIFTTPDLTLNSFAQAIAAFERTEFFSPFDSKYDRYLRGEYRPNEREELGMTLFFSNQFTNCNQCHQLQQFPASTGETFTNYRYENIGVPINTSVREYNGVIKADEGLATNPNLIGTPEVNIQRGKFKVPTLRNAAITSPYMHNGVFKDLQTVIKFYNSYLSRARKAQINPETGEQWAAPEISENLALDKLQSGRALGAREIDALIAFIEMLTDKRYEVLLNPSDRAVVHADPQQ